MIGSQKVWETIREHIPRKQWIPSKDIFAVVELHGSLEEEDRRPLSPRSKVPRWKVVVRHVLAERKKSGELRSRTRPNTGN